MTYFIIYNGNEFGLVGVKPADMDNFMEDYGAMIRDKDSDRIRLFHRHTASRPLVRRLAQTLDPKMTVIRRMKPRKLVLALKQYHHANYGWIPCSRQHPADGHVMNFLEQLAIAFVAEADDLVLNIVNPKSGTVSELQITIKKLMQ